MSSLTRAYELAQEGINGAYITGEIEREEFVRSIIDLHTARSLDLNLGRCLCGLCVEHRGRALDGNNRLVRVGDRVLVPDSDARGIVRDLKLTAGNLVMAIVEVAGATGLAANGVGFYTGELVVLP